MKPRNREVNIFNMSLLDILCGALGAFCFMMLSLLPYYRPPGKDISVSKEQKELLDELQKIKDLTERLKSASTAEDLTELVEQLRKEIVLLENRIKKLQGEVNALYAENDELKGRVAKLEVENGILRTRNELLEKDNQQLKARNQQLQQEKQQLLAEKQQLQREKQQLEQEKRKLENRLSEKLPWMVMVTGQDPGASMRGQGGGVTLDCSLHELSVTADDGSRQADFDPGVMVQPVRWNGDFRMGGTGSVTRVNASRFVTGESKFYIRVISRPGGMGQSFPILLQTSVSGNSLDPVNVPQVSLPLDRTWVYVGKFRVESLTRIIFTEASQAEREQEWLRLEKPAEPPKPEPTPAPAALTDAVMGPGFEKRKKDYETRAGPGTPPPVRDAMLQLWLAEAQSPQERAYVGEQIKRFSPPYDRRRIPGPEPSGSDDPRAAADAARRRGQYMSAINSAASKDEKIGLLRKWMNEATTDSERDLIRQMLQRTNVGPAPGPAVSPGTGREQSLEEFRRRGESPTLPPPPPPQPQQK